MDVTDEEVAAAAANGTTLMVPILFGDWKAIPVTVLRACAPNRDGGRGPRHDGSATWMVLSQDLSKSALVGGFDSGGRYYCPAVDLRRPTAQELLDMDD